MEAEQATMPISSVFILTEREIGQIKAHTTCRKRTCRQFYWGKGKRRATSENEAFSLTPTLPILRPTSSNLDKNRICCYCKSLRHHQTNCPDYYSQVCRELVPGHLSLYCPHFIGPSSTTLTWKGEGFYQELCAWEKVLDDTYISQYAEEEAFYHEEQLRGGDICGSYSDNPIYWANQDE